MGRHATSPRWSVRELRCICRATVATFARTPFASNARTAPTTRCAVEPPSALSCRGAAYPCAVNGD
jgi:hypothetical protein